LPYLQASPIRDPDNRRSRRRANRTVPSGTRTSPLSTRCRPSNTTLTTLHPHWATAPGLSIVNLTARRSCCVKVSLPPNTPQLHLTHVVCPPDTPQHLPTNAAALCPSSSRNSRPIQCSSHNPCNLTIPRNHCLVGHGMPLAPHGTVHAIHTNDCNHCRSPQSTHLQAQCIARSTSKPGSLGNRQISPQRNAHLWRSTYRRTDMHPNDDNARRTQRRIGQLTRHTHQTPRRAR